MFNFDQIPESFSVPIVADNHVFTVAPDAAVYVFDLNRLSRN